MGLAELNDEKAVLALLPRLRDEIAGSLKEHTVSLRGAELRAVPKARAAAAGPVLRLRVQGARVRLWADIGAAARLDPSLGVAAPGFALLGGTDRPALAATIKIDPQGNGWLFRLDGVNGMEEVLAALAIYGVRRYLVNTKTAEAKNTVGAMARAAAAAFERERVGPGGAARHDLCKGAVPVPGKVPSGMKYVPSGRDGQDFQTGNEDAGWRCLRFQTSLFTRTGQVNTSTQQLVISTQIFVSDEYE